MSSIAACLSVGAFGADVEVVTIKTLRAQMRYDVSEFTVKPGQQVKILFQNEDDMPHNLCFFQPGTDVVAAANKQMEKPEEAIKRNWLPEDPRMWQHSNMLNPKQSEEIGFKAPEQLGTYPYVCTFPGHAAIMQGKMKVVASGPGLTDLKFRLYLGDWKALPDFAALKPHREGAIADNLVQLRLDDYKNQFGVVYTAKLKAPREGDYVFMLASDDGARILLDGKKVVDNDGIHPASDVREGRVRLKAGEHEFRLEYFQGAGETELFAAWRGAGFSTTPLSKTLHPNWKGGGKPKKKSETTGMPIVVGKEPVVYRNFIAGAGERGIAVGYPGSANIALSAESFGLALAWRGAFMDAARHWNSRGGGHQAPLGFDVIRPVPERSLPFAVASAGANEWPAIAKGARAEGYAWKGYELDAKRHPVFHYEWRGVKVSERFEVQGDALAGAGKLVRVLKLDGKLPAGSRMLVASGESLQFDEKAGCTVRGAKFSLDGVNHENVFHVQAVCLMTEEKRLVVPLTPEIRITYSWPSAHGPHAHAH